MSSTYVPVTRRADVIGCNIRPGVTPGGFSHVYTASPKKNVPRRNRRGRGTRDIIEAANAVLEGRGFINQPNSNDSTARGTFRSDK